MDLTTLARVQSFAELSSNAADDALIGTLITGVSMQIEKFLDRHVESKARTERLDVLPGQTTLFLKGYPVSSVTSLKNDSEWDFGSSTELATTLYNVDTDEGEINFKRNTLLQPGQKVIQVTYTGGMAATTAAFITAFPDIAYAADQQVSFMFRRRTSQGNEVTSIPGHTVTVNTDMGLLADVIKKLQVHRRVSVGI